MKKSIVSLVAVSVLMLASCKKSSTPDNSNDAAAFTTGMQNLINTYQPVKHVVSISADNGGQIIGASTRFYFSPGAFINSSGNTVTGNVQIEYQEFSKKGQMVLGNKTTMGTEGLLQSSGEVYINATQNGNQLQLKPLYSAIYFHGKSLTQPMNYYTGTTAGTLGNITWQKGLDSLTLATYTAAQCSCATVVIDSNNISSGYDTLYQFTNPKLGWMNCDYFVAYPNLTPITITTPVNFAKNNTAVYLVFKTIDLAANVFGNGNSFTLSGAYTVPIGMQATIVVLSEHNGQWYSCFKDITITANDVESVTLTPTTLADYASRVMAL